MFPFERPGLKAFNKMEIIPNTIVMKAAEEQYAKYAHDAGHLAINLKRTCVNFVVMYAMEPFAAYYDLFLHSIPKGFMTTHMIKLGKLRGTIMSANDDDRLAVAKAYIANYFKGIPTAVAEELPNILYKSIIGLEFNYGVEEARKMFAIVDSTLLDSGKLIMPKRDQMSGEDILQLYRDSAAKALMERAHGWC